MDPPLSNDGPVVVGCVINDYLGDPAREDHQPRGTGNLPNAEEK